MANFTDETFLDAFFQTNSRCMIPRIALYAIRFSASKGKNGKDFSVFFSMRLRVSRHSSICLILYFYFFHSQKRTHRDSIPFKEGAKEKESLQEFSVEKSPSFERERERGGKIDPHPISSTNNETIEQMEIGDVAGYQPASHAGAKQRRPCFSSEKSGIYTPS